MKNPLSLLFYFSAIFLLVVSPSCSDDKDTPPSTPFVSTVSIADISNFGDGRDLEVSFAKVADEDLISGYRVIIVKSSAASAFTLTMAQSLTADRYMDLAPDNTNKKVTLVQTAKDSDGAAITEGQSYNALVLTIGESGKNKLSSTSNALTLTLPETPVVGSVTITDISNFGDGRDIRVAFNKVTDESLITDYRVIVVKSSAIASFNLVAAEALPATSYTVVAKTGANQNSALAQTTKDSDGELIMQDNQYAVFVMTTGAGRNSTLHKLSAASNILTVEIPSAPLAAIVSVLDVSNNATGKDIEVKFTKATNENMISSYRIIVVKESSVPSFNLATAESLAPSRYHNVLKTGSDQQLELTADLLDSDGASIQEATNYKVYVLSMADGTVAGKNSLSSASATILLSQKNAVRTFAVFANAGTGGLQVDNDGNVYFGNFGLTDSGGGTQIFKITPESIVSTFATGFSTADGNDMDSQGNLYAISWPNTIFKITPTGTKTVFATSTQINIPIGISIDSDDNLFVTCYNGNNIVKITQGGAISVFSSSPLYNGPNGIDADATGNLYVSNWNDGNVIKVDKDNGSAELFVTLPSSQKAHLVVHNENIYVAGRAAHTIYKVTLTKQVSSFLGTGVRGDLNGTLSTATISWPNDIAFNADGTKMYISMVGLSAPAQNIISPAVIKEVSIVE